MNNNCLYCYQPLGEGDKDFHSKCSRKIFGTKEAPILDYSLDQMHELARKVVQSHVTVPGVQAKLAFHFEPKRGQESRLTLVGVWGNYILKPPTTQFANLPENEDLTMHLASLFKIKTVPHSLIRLKSGELAYITKRIDRVKGAKLPMEDLCQLSERLTEDKYKGSMEQVGKVIMQYSSNPLFDAQVFFEVALFSFLTGNADMHLKNFSMIDLDNGLTQLAPAYDLLSTRLVIPEKDDPEELALTMNGRKRKFRIGDFQQLAKSLKLNQKQVDNIFKRFKKAMPTVLDFINNSFLPEDKKLEYRELIQVRASRLFA
ncbi:HipA domain-containing protein [Saccharicrinis fermentans]|uniref:Serine/threonine-protein kinase HipA n=1 Tax=Saccharicrinis fermentans DSM 9555 = JCM 21142 TaxID=869213 RepID=W7YMI3_9BACT|nr:HipA domain-containing protein [Saccharicrinis fermentans]GAF05881.1 serine/threonine-protein kinase HipA [Saccharicrinis fermentans DSM 9555 = JCM 21142]